ncbi:MAG: DNA mismatch repair endonuclease MutL [Ruminococcaceae bacterium]|nr:DNA mismatch repair endonuclease MutL [Oscillospiraceae bacterium]
MGKINVLSFAVANLIAAGEVVDRPASVIKELLENAIDSGADRITVEIQNGGVTYMRVSDNGCGMSAEDLPVSIRRHATSKIKNAEDLNGILTLGFRGEALAAIASVSDIRIISKTADAQSGAMLEARGGEIIGVTERAASNGTTVIVENLFANVPARRKFLKKDVTEAMAISAVVEKIALSKPNIAFRLIVDGNVRIDTVGDGTLKTAIYSIFGKDFASKLIPAENNTEGIKVHGFIGRSDNVRANRNYQNFFINGRYVKSRTAGAAIEQAYTSYIPPEKFPCCILFIEINPATVDVNVHPAKLEVKFSNEKPVFEAIYYAVRNSLETNTTRPSVTLNSPRTWTSQGKVSDSSTPIVEERSESLKKRQIESELYLDKKITEMPVFKNNETKRIDKQEANSAFSKMTASEYVKTFSSSNSQEVSKKPLDVKTEEPKVFEKEKNVKETPKPIEQTVTKPIEPPAEVKTETVYKKVEQKLNYRIIGEAFNAYVVVEVGDRMLVIDKHAAHERIIFEQLKAGMKNDDRASQMLMLPIEVMLTSDEIHIISQYSAEIEAIGFEFTTGKYTVSVTAIPEGISTDAVGDMFAVIADRIKNNTGSAKLTRDIIFEKALYQASCKAAIKAGREYPPEYVKWLVDRLMELPDITVCPHGRPVAMELSKKDLDRQFERT